MIQKEKKNRRPLFKEPLPAKNTRLEEGETEIGIDINEVNSVSNSGFMKNQDIRRQSFHKLDSFYTYVFFVSGESVLLVAFVKNILSELYSHCTQKFNFYYFLETKICFMTNNFSLSCKVNVLIFSKNQ